MVHLRSLHFTRCKLFLHKYYKKCYKEKIPLKLNHLLFISLQMAFPTKSETQLL